MPPYSSSARLVRHDNDGDGRKNCLGQDHWNRALGFTAPLIESIFKSKSLLQDWVDNEKSKMNLRAESYRESLGKQESIIKSQVAELTIVQRERGMSNEMLKDTNCTSNDNNSDEDHQENKKDFGLLTKRRRGVRILSGRRYLARRKCKRIQENHPIC